MRHCPHFHIALPYANVLYSLYWEYSRLPDNKTHREIEAKDVCKAFDGNNNYCSTSLIQAAHTAVRLPSSVIAIILNGISTEAPQRCLNKEYFNVVNTVIVSLLTEVSDCSLYSSISHTSSLQSVAVLVIIGRLSVSILNFSGYCTVKTSPNN